MQRDGIERDPIGQMRIPETAYYGIHTARAGFREIRLPSVQPGSSILPGKVNPVVPEVVNEIA